MRQRRSGARQRIGPHLPSPFVAHSFQSKACPPLSLQPRDDKLAMFTEALGWEVVHPEEAALLHVRVPVAFTDAPLVEKQIA